MSSRCRHLCFNDEDVFSLAPSVLIKICNPETLAAAFVHSAHEIDLIPSRKVLITLQLYFL